MSTTDQTAANLFRAGKLNDAIAAQAALRKAPTNLSARVLLAELLAFSGNLERADAESASIVVVISVFAAPAVVPSPM